MIDKQQPREVPYRFVNLAVYIFAALVNCIPVHTFSSINQLYQVVTANALLFAIFHPIAAFPANWILYRYGSKVGCTIGSVLVIIGVWLRTFMDYGKPEWCLVGSCFAALGTIFIINTPIKIAVNWFKQTSIPTIIFATILANLVSSTLGASIPGLVLDKNASKQQILSFIRIQAIVVSIPLIILIFFYKQKPQIPPSRSAAIVQKRQKYLSLLKKLFTNKQYLKILLAITFAYGTQIAFISTLDQILKSLRYDDPGQTTSYTILFAMIVGIIANPIFSRLIKKTLKYKLITSLNLLGSYISFGALIYIYSKGVSQFAYIAIAASFVGIFFIPMTSLFFAYSAEVVFPVGEGSAGGYLFAGSQTFGFVFGFVIISVIDSSNRQNSLMCLIICNALIGLALLMILWTKQDLRRLNYETSSKKDQEISKKESLQDSLIVDSEGFE